MSANISCSLVAGLTVSFLLLAPVRAEDKKAQMSEEMQAQMAKVKEAGTPGAEHAVLKNLEGNWTVKSRAWMKPGDKPQQSTASSSFS